MNTRNRINLIRERLAPLRTALLDHPIYNQITSMERLHIFMRHHVFAVWDFMCLLNCLQQSLCPSRVPWLPPADSAAVRLINEIVLGEECDADGSGGFSSHFQLYHRAMKRCGAATVTIDRLLKDVETGQSVESALANCNAPRAVRQFVTQTFDVIAGGDLCAVAAAFTFGREDLLPDVFQRIVDELNTESAGELEDFRYYLQRHIELDGDHHGPMAEMMLAELCRDDDLKWRIAEQAAVRSLQARRQLWNGMLDAMQTVEPPVPSSQSPLIPQG